MAEIKECSYDLDNYHMKLYLTKSLIKTIWHNIVIETPCLHFVNQELTLHLKLKCTSECTLVYLPGNVKRKKLAILHEKNGMFLKIFSKVGPFDLQ